MKKEVSAYIKQFNCTTEYSGKDKTMYVHGAKADEAIEEAKKAFPLRPFKIC